MTAASEARAEARIWFREARRWVMLTRVLRTLAWKREAFRYAMQCRKSAHKMLRQAAVSR